MGNIQDFKTKYIFIYIYIFITTIGAQKLLIISLPNPRLEQYKK